MTAKSENAKSETPKTEKKPNSELVPQQTRWVKNAFFRGGSTKNVRLDEIHNQLNNNVANTGDITDYELAKEIISRAGLVEHVRFNELVQGLADFLETIPDPAMEWVNPNYGHHFPKNIAAK